eukprot:458355-Pleurochrysis_carterae.AAC.3
MDMRHFQYSSKAGTLRRSAAMCEASASSTRMSRRRIMALARSCATPLARVHPIAMTSSSRSHASLVAPVPAAFAAGARNPVFQMLCSA